jgi:hypothetical protein
MPYPKRTDYRNYTEFYLACEKWRVDNNVPMRSLTHGELEKHHYQALKENPLYREEFQHDILREELMMAMPIVPETATPAPVTIPEKPYWLSHKQWDEINQLKGMLVHLQNKVKELEIEKRPEKKPPKGTIPL